MTQMYTACLYNHFVISSSEAQPPCVTFRLVAVPLWGPGQSPVLPFACCVGLLLSVGVVSAFAAPSGWYAGAVLDVAWCAVCASVAPSSWRIEVVLVVAGAV